jgi:hypothetical protein
MHSLAKVEIIASSLRWGGGKATTAEREFAFSPRECSLFWSQAIQSGAAAGEALECAGLLVPYAGTARLMGVHKVEGSTGALLLFLRYQGGAGDGLPTKTLSDIVQRGGQFPVFLRSLIEK